MLQNIDDRARLGVGTERQVLIAKCAPDGDHLVGLACVSVERVLERGKRRSRHSICGDFNMRVIHLNRFLYRKSRPNRPFSSRTAMADQFLFSAHSMRTMTWLVLAMLVI